MSKSDYDFGIVVFDVKKTLEDQIEVYSKVYDILSKELAQDLNGCKIDISFLQRASPALQMSAIRNGKILFEADPRFRVDFEEEVMKKYLDYLPLKREFEEATFSAFR